MILWATWRAFGDVAKIRLFPHGCGRRAIAGYAREHWYSTQLFGRRLKRVRGLHGECNCEWPVSTGAPN